MTIYSSYGIRIKEYRHIFDETVTVYRSAVDYFIDVCEEHWEEIASYDAPLKRCNYVEKLVHNTKNNIAAYDFDAKFYKLPSYYRRAAISSAIGMVSSYRSNLANWENVGRKPCKPKAGYTFPILYHKECFRKTEDKYVCEIKVRIRNTWDWITVSLRKSDVDYIDRHCASRRRLSPSLVKRGKLWLLVFPFEEHVKLTEKVDTILAVDLGINSACTCSVMTSDGTILGRKFLKLPGEQDSLMHALNRIKKAQQHGNYKTPRLWARAKGINDHIAQLTADFIIDTAVYYNVDCIVFEHLDLKKKKRGSKKQKLHMWKANTVQRIVTDKAHRLHMRISRVCAWGTSKYAYDGSGTVERGIDDNYSLCRFTSGKIYNCDLSASYNIGARYIIREIVKSLPETARVALEAKVPQIAKRSTCTYSTLISLIAELEELVLPADSKSAVEAAA